MSSAPSPSAEGFVPAAGRAFLLPLYDRAIALTMREERFRSALVAGVAATGAQRVLELGAGTGALTLRLARVAREVTGLDPDPDALARARRKDPAGRVTWVQGSATAPELPGGAFDAVVASLMLHHLGTEAKAQALREAHRVLRPGGTLHVADWGRPGDPAMRLAFLALRALDGFEPTRVHAQGRLPEVIAHAGFADVRRRDRLRTGFGVLELLSATRR